jgi:hypothetical protein
MRMDERKHWISADEIHMMDSWFTIDNNKSGEPTESQLMRMKVLKLLDYNWWEWERENSFTKDDENEGGELLD